MFVLPERSSATNTNEENGLVLRHYWTNTCESCAIKRRCTTAKERRITHWEHEHVLEAVQKRLDKNPQAMRQRRKTMLRKYFLDISQDEQRRRFEARVDNPLKHWKLSPMDIESVRRWWDYTAAYLRMIQAIHTPEAPWYIVPGDDKRRARLSLIRHLLNSIPYKKVEVDLPKIPKPQPRPKGCTEALGVGEAIPNYY